MMVLRYSVMVRYNVAQNITESVNIAACQRTAGYRTDHDLGLTEDELCYPSTEDAIPATHARIA